MILMEELDISPSEFKKRFESQETSPEDNKIKNIALRCEGIKGNSLNYPDGVRKFDNILNFPSLELCATSFTSFKE